VNRDAEGLPIFAGDAIADPLSGICAAAAALQAIANGGGTLVDLSMAAVARSLAGG
jgi:hypothetical protein